MVSLVFQVGFPVAVVVAEAFPGDGVQSGGGVVPFQDGFIDLKEGVAGKVLVDHRSVEDGDGGGAQPISYLTTIV
jgi:hypothetical protein